MKHRKESIQGQRFGRLTVVSLDRVNGTRQYWLCRCDCGAEKVIVRNSLVSGNTSSCGCLRKETANSYRPEVPITEDSAYGKVFSTYKSDSLRRRVLFDIDYEHAKTLFKGNCYYCDCPPATNKKVYSRKKDVEVSYPYNGIDKVIPALGYTKENTVSCCKYCNRAKSDQTTEEFILRIRRIHDKWHKA